MSWTPLVPIVKTTGRPMISAAVKVLKDGQPRLYLYLSGMLCDELGRPETCRVMAGSGERAGQVRIEFKGGREFKVSPFVHGGGRITAPAFIGLPSKPAETLTCRIVERDDAAGVLVAALPIDEWAQSYAERTQPKASRPPPAPVAPKPQPLAQTPIGKPFDPIEYLTAKGHKCSRLAGGRFALNGETVLAADLLAVVNSHRKQADLPPLTLAAIK